MAYFSQFQSVKSKERLRLETRQSDPVIIFYIKNTLSAYCWVMNPSSRGSAWKPWQMVNTIIFFHAGLLYHSKHFLLQSRAKNKVISSKCYIYYFLKMKEMQSSSGTLWSWNTAVRQFKVERGDEYFTFNIYFDISSCLQVRLLDGTAWKLEVALIKKW